MSNFRLTSPQRRLLRRALGATDDASYYRRLLAVLELDRGRPAAEVAAALGVTRQSVSHWARAYRRAPRPATLADHYGGGRPTAWTDDLQALLRSCFRQRPDQLGYAAVNWTVPVLQEHLRRRAGVWLSDDTIRRQLQRWGYVWKRFRYVLPPDPEREKKTAHPAAAPATAAAQPDPGRG
jgi:transposase